MLMPYRETIEMDFYVRHDRHEVLAFLTTPMNGWYPMIALWPIDASEVEESAEDIISICGSHFAYCISDDKPEDFDTAIVKTGPTMIGPTYLLAIGALMRRVV